MKICCCHSADSCLSCKKSFRNTEKRKYCRNVSASFQTKIKTSMPLPIQCVQPVKAHKTEPPHTFSLLSCHQLLLDNPRQTQATRPEPSLFAPPFLTSHQTPQYCTTPAANWRFCGGLGFHCWGPVLPIWIAEAEAKELRDACLQSH